MRLAKRDFFTHGLSLMPDCNRSPLTPAMDLAARTALKALAVANRAFVGPPQIRF